MAKEEQDSKRNLSQDFSKKFGTINVKGFYKAQEAIRDGKDVSLVSERIASQHTTIRGDEIQEWGLNLDSLLVKNEMELYEREIL